MQFYYSIPTIEALVNRFLTIQVYMDTGIANKSVFLGQVKVTRAGRLLSLCMPISLWFTRL